jgi:hypothetical protein
MLVRLKLPLLTQKAFIEHLLYFKLGAMGREQDKNR